MSKSCYRDISVLIGFAALSMNDLHDSAVTNEVGPCCVFDC